MKILNIFIFLLAVFSFILIGYLENTGKATWEKEHAIVMRIVDGDTIETDLGKVRMLGINTPEKNMFGYQEARDFLNKSLYGKKIEIERTVEDRDKYGRLLRYVFLGDKMINEEILRKGLASFYSYKEDRFTTRLEKAELDARQSERGIWRKSRDYGCLKLVEFDHEEEERCHNQEKIVLQNDCGKMSIVLKDDATHIYKEDIEAGRWEKIFSCVWNDEGDSLYIWDEEGLLLFERY